MMIRSPFHFAGNKKRALKNGLFPFIQTNGRLWDIMLGSGSVLYNSNGGVGFDSNRAVICLHQWLADSYDFVECVQDVYETWFGPGDRKKQYYELRSSVNSKYLSPRYGELWAARLYVLTQLSYNSLLRFNLKGEYNVPYGHGQKKFDLQRIVDAKKRSGKLGLEFKRQGIEEFLVSEVCGDDVVYMDPPYYLTYTKQYDWGLEQQEYLEFLCRKLDRWNKKFVLSNVLVYRGTENDRLINFANEHKFHITTIGKLTYDNWAHAVKAVRPYGNKTQECVVSNFLP